MSREGAKDSPKDRRRGGGSRPSPKVQPPDKKKFEKETSDITRRIKELEARLWSQMPAQRASSSETTSQIAEVQAELGEIDTQKSNNSAEVRRIEDQLKRMGSDVIHKRDESSKLMAGLRYKTEERIDEAAGKLEQQLQLKQFSSTEERRLQLEIDTLRRSKDRLKEYLDCKQEVDKLRNEQEQLRKRRDSLYRSNRGLRGRESDLKDELAEIRKGVGKRRERLREEAAKKEALTKDIDALYRKRQELREDFRRQQAQYLEMTEESREAERQIREEEARKRKESREFRRRRQAEEREMARELQYDEEKTICRTLLAHMQKVAMTTGGISMATNGVVPEEEVTQTSVRGDTSGHQPGEFLRKKEDVDMLLPPAASTSGRRKSRRDKKRSAPTSKSPKRLQYNPDLLRQFSFLGISPPTTHSEVPSTITELREKQAFYESKSALKPAESEAGDSGVGSTGFFEFTGSQEDFLTLESALHKRHSIDDGSGRCNIQVSPTSEDPQKEEESPTFLHLQSNDSNTTSGSSVSVTVGNSIDE